MGKQRLRRVGRVGADRHGAGLCSGRRCYDDGIRTGGCRRVHDSVDLFSVGLRLLSGEELHLFYFYGDGTFSNDGPWPDWLYWEDYVYDMSGTQERESRAYVDLLAKMIGVPVIPGRR